MFISGNFWNLGNKTGEGKGTEEDLQIQFPQPYSVPVDCVTRLLAFQASDEVELSWFLNQLKGIMYPSSLKASETSQWRKAKGTGS